jgi:uncharacterized repeat protein (TIGR01451 family)
MSQVSPGDIVTFEIEVFNQGSYVADLIEITDLFPTAAFTLVDSDWTTAVVGTSNTTTTRILNSGPNPEDELGPTGLQPGTSVVVTIDLQVNNMPNPSPEDYVNFAEISRGEDAFGPRPDEDSTPDGILGNDNGGGPGVVGRGQRH